jgi:predicted metal-dependent enzyme (double-stranded beta helix superfamily)
VNGELVELGKSDAIGLRFALGEAVIHSVTNPLDRITAAIHVYGGDFFVVPRSEWDPQTLQERPFDIEHAKEVFEEANKRLASPDTVQR